MSNQGHKRRQKERGKPNEPKHGGFTLGDVTGFNDEKRRLEKIARDKRRVKKSKTLLKHKKRI